MLPTNIGRYQIIGELGRGGMAAVYRAHDPGFGRDVAIKVLPRELLHDPNFRARFDREAHLIAALEHPAIVPVHDYGEDGGQPYIVMRLMSGGSLSERLNAGPLSVTETARILSALAPAIDRAHARGVIHRDLKPSNILFDEDGNPFLSDFGIARLTEGSGAMTGTAMVGTPAYMSPEQARGGKDLDGRSDLYALGVIVFEMLAGRRPYEGDTPISMALKHVTDPVPRISDLQPDLPPAAQAFIDKAMAKMREARYQSAGALAGDLAKLPRLEPRGSQPGTRRQLPWQASHKAEAARTPAQPPSPNRAPPTPSNAPTELDRPLMPLPATASAELAETEHQLTNPRRRNPPVWGWALGGLAVVSVLVGGLWSWQAFGQIPRPTAVSAAHTPTAPSTPATTVMPTSPPETAIGAVRTATVGPTVLEGDAAIEDPYVGARQDRSAALSIGGQGAGPGQFEGPRDVAVGPDGSIYVADTRNHRIQKFDASGNFVLAWGTLGRIDNDTNQPGTFNEPWGLAVGPDGSVYVADTWNHRVQKFNADGGFLTTWGYFGQAEAPEALWGPRDVAVDALGRVYVADAGNKRVAVFDANGLSVTTFGVGGSDRGQFDEPVGLATTSDGLLFVADTWNQRVQVFRWEPLDEEYTFVRDWPIVGWYSQSLDNKPHLAVDGRDRVYVSDPEGFRVLVFDAAGNFLATWGDYGLETNRFGLLNGVAADAAGNVYAADAGNNRVLVFPALP